MLLSRSRPDGALAGHERGLAAFVLEAGLREADLAPFPARRIPYTRPVRSQYRTALRSAIRALDMMFWPAPLNVVLC